MGKPRFKKIDIENEVPEQIPDGNSSLKKEYPSKDIVFRKANIIVEPSESYFKYLLFGIQSACEEYGIDYTECLVIMYLEELGLFNLWLRVFNRVIPLGDYVLKGLIEEDYSHRNIKLYKISKRSVEIIKKINKVVSDDSKLVGYNRKTDLTMDVKMKSVLFEYFDLNAD